MEIDHSSAKLIDRDLSSPTIHEILAPFRAGPGMGPAHLSEPQGIGAHALVAKARENPKPECQNPKEIQSPNPEMNALLFFVYFVYFEVLFLR